VVRLGLVLAVLAAMGASAWLSWTDRRPPRGLHWLQGSLARIDIQFACWGLAIHSRPGT
jgi:hypothetical protein